MSAGYIPPVTPNTLGAHRHHEINELEEIAKRVQTACKKLLGDRNGIVEIGLNHLAKSSGQSRPQAWFTLYSKSDSNQLKKELKEKGFDFLGDQWQFRRKRGKEERYQLRTFAGCLFNHLKHNGLLPKAWENANVPEYRTMMQIVRDNLYIETTNQKTISPLITHPVAPAPVSSLSKVSSAFQALSQASPPSHVSSALTPSSEKSSPSSDDERVDKYYEDAVNLFKEFGGYGCYEFKIGSPPERPSQLSQIHLRFLSSEKREAFVKMLADQYEMELEPWQTSEKDRVIFSSSQTDRLLGLREEYNKNAPESYNEEWEVIREVLNKVIDNQVVISTKLYNTVQKEFVERKIMNAVEIIAKCKEFTVQQMGSTFQIKYIFSDDAEKNVFCALLVQDYNLELKDLQQTEKTVILDASQFARVIGVDRESPIQNAALSEIVSELEKSFPGKPDTAE